MADLNKKHTLPDKLTLFIYHRLLRYWYCLERIPPFFQAAFSKRGLPSREGRILIWGKCRRFLLSLFPAYARRLQKKHGLSGGCVSCGASCNLLFKCPHWDDSSHLCTVYDDRPSICRTFPITPADIRDRNIILKNKECGFKFSGKGKKPQK